MTWALSQKLKAPEKLVLLLLAYRTNPDTDVADATLDKLATECGMSRSGLKKVIQRLELAELIEVEIRKVDGGKNLPNLYRMTYTDRGHDVTPLGSGRDRSRGHDVTTKAGSNSDSSSSTRAGFDFSTWPGGTAPANFDAWVAMRRKKKADVTPLVMEAMGKQLHAAADIGWTVDDVLEECCFRNWQGFKASWLEPKTRKPQPGRAGASGQSNNVSGHYAQGTQRSNSRGPTSAFDRVAEAARNRAPDPAVQSGAGPDRGDDDRDLRPSLDFDPR